MYSPAAGKPFCFLANASYLFSKTYPSPGETEKKKQWTWCMRLASFSAEHFNTWEEGAREGFYTHLWVLEEQCIKSRTQSGGVAKKKKKDKEKMNMSSFSCKGLIHVQLRSCGYRSVNYITRLNFMRYSHLKYSHRRNGIKIYAMHKSKPKMHAFILLSLKRFFFLIM